VCVVAPSLRILGGQAIQADRLVRHLREDGRVDVGFIPHNPALPAPLDRLQRIKFVRTVVNTITYLGLLLWRVPRYDVIHVFSAAYWSYALGPMLAILVARLYGREVILNYRSGELEDHLRTWPRWVARTMGLSRIITPTPHLTEVYAQFGLEAGVIPNYLDLHQRRYRVRTPLRPVFLVNRLFEPLYDYPCALEAFRLIQAEVPEARLLIAGYGPLREQILRWIEEKGLRNVDFRGKVSPAEMNEMYHEADIYLNTPRLDCFPSSILDAFASGAPVVTTNAGGIRHIVEHDRTGWMVECGDAAGLARGALAMLRDPEYGRRLATAGRREVETRYVWEAVGPQWERTYERLSGRPLG
jgi:glycosyltransferase involved in cell wall biosynthesis